jgi:hypothetical protein
MWPEPDEFAVNWVGGVVVLSGTSPTLTEASVPRTNNHVVLYPPFFPRTPSPRIARHQAGLVIGVL